LTFLKTLPVITPWDNARNTTEAVIKAVRNYYLERKYPSFDNLALCDIALRAAKEVCDKDRGVGDFGTIG
jgi:hypothetical protein